jgi:hypothetical protein
VVFSIIFVFFWVFCLERAHTIELLLGFKCLVTGYIVKIKYLVIFFHGVIATGIFRNITFQKMCSHRQIAGHSRLQSKTSFCRKMLLVCSAVACVKGDLSVLVMHCKKQTAYNIPMNSTPSPCSLSGRLNLVLMLQKTLRELFFSVGYRNYSSTFVVINVIVAYQFCG